MVNSDRIVTSKRLNPANSLDSESHMDQIEALSCKEHFEIPKSNSFWLSDDQTRAVVQGSYASAKAKTQQKLLQHREGLSSTNISTDGTRPPIITISMYASRVYPLLTE